MSAPVEFRFFYRRYQLSDLKQGIPSMRGPNGDLFLSPTLQFRHKQKIVIGDSISFEFTEWLEIPHVYDDTQPMPGNLQPS